MKPQAWHLLVLLLVVIVVFGASKLPDITRNIGKSMKIFKEEVKDLREDSNTVKDSVNPSTADSSSDTAPASDVPPTSR